MKSNINLTITVGTAGENLFPYFDQLIELAIKHNGQVHYVQVTADKETLLARVENEDRKEAGKKYLLNTHKHFNYIKRINS